jgi:hypothetical protein
MKRFGYWRDSLFLAGCAFYALNRWIVKPHVHSPFFRGQFNDCLLIPCALPLVLWLQRQLGLRKHDLFPTTAEIALHLVVWSLLCEVIGPLFLPVTGDAKDVVAYAAGTVVSWAFWRWQQQKQPQQTRKAAATCTRA